MSIKLNYVQKLEKNNNFCLKNTSYIQATTK